VEFASPDVQNDYVTFKFRAANAVESVKSVKPGERVTVTTGRVQRTARRPSCPSRPITSRRRTPKDGGRIPCAASRLGCSLPNLPRGVAARWLYTTAFAKSGRASKILIDYPRQPVKVATESPRNRERCATRLQ